MRLTFPNLVKCYGVVLTSLCVATSTHAEIYYDDLTDDVEVYSYELVSGGELEWVDDGLNFATDGPNGVRIVVDGEELPHLSGWSVRARYTINDVTGLGLAGIGVEYPQRWAAVFGSSGEFATGEGFNPETVAIPEGNVFNTEFVAQLDAFGESIRAHFWRPDSPTDVTTIEYSRTLTERSFTPRFANNSADITYHEIWASDSPLPLPSGFEDQGDFGGNGIIDADDLELLHEQARTDGELIARYDLDSDGEVGTGDVAKWVTEFYGSWIGDANLDGQFDSSDLVQVFAANEYEDAIAGNSTWAEGDWNADGDFDSGDLVAAFKDNGYEYGERLAVVGVPEPSSLSAIAIGCWLIVLRRNR